MLFWAKFQTFLNSTIIKVSISLILFFGLVLPFSTPVYATTTLESLFPVYTTPLINFPSASKANTMLSYVNTYLFPNFADTHYFNIASWGSGSSFRYRVELWPKSTRFGLRANSYTVGGTTSLTFSHKGYSIIRYDFDVDGVFKTQSTENFGFAGSINLNTVYYTSFPASVPVVNFDFNAFVPEIFYNIYSQGAKYFLDDSYYKSSSTVLGQGPGISDANLIKMFNIISEENRFWTLNYYYIVRPLMSSTLVTGWQVVLIPNREEFDYTMNRFMAYDYESDDWIDSIYLEYNGEKTDIRLYSFTTDFKLVGDAPLTDVAHVNYTRVPVSYSDVKTELRLLAVVADAGEYITIPDSPELRASVGQRPLPDSVLSTFAPPPDALLTNNLDIPIDIVKTMFSRLGDDYPNWLIDKGQYLVIEKDDYYYLAYSPLGFAKFLAKTSPDPGYTLEVWADKRVPIIEWLVWSPGSEKQGQAALKFYTFDKTGKFISKSDQSGEYLRSVATSDASSVYYSNLECGRYDYTPLMGIVPTPLVSYDCSLYGLRAMPVEVYNTVVIDDNKGLPRIPGYGGSSNPSDNLSASLSDFVQFIDDFFYGDSILYPILGFLPKEIVVLADISLKLFLFALVYKIIRIIRGLTV